MKMKMIFSLSNLNKLVGKGKSNNLDKIITYCSSSGDDLVAYYSTVNHFGHHFRCFHANYC